MDRDEQVKLLLEYPYYLIDIFPAKVGENRFSAFSDVEEYFLGQEELKNISDKFIRIILKLFCYYPCSVHYKNWQSQVNAIMLAGWISEIIVKQQGFLNILLDHENVLIQVDGGELHLTVYHAHGDVADILKVLTCSEGLFWRCGID